MTVLPDAIQALAPALVEGTRTTRIVNYMATGGYALTVVDYLQTLPDEVRIMWPAPMSFPKVLFFTLRYYLFIHTLLSATFAYATDLSPEACSSRFLRATLSDQALVIVSEVVLFVRVYAFSGRDKRVLAWLIAQFVGIHAVTKVYLLVKYNRTVKFIQSPFSSLYCIPSAMDNRILNMVFGLLLASIIIVMLMMVYIALMKYRNLNKNLLMVFHQDGIFYFILLSGLDIASIIINTSAPDGGLKFLFINTQVNLHAILASRMILHLRLWSERHSHGLGLVVAAEGDPDIPFTRSINGTYDYKSKVLSSIRFESRTVESVESQETSGSDACWTRQNTS